MVCESALKVNNKQPIGVFDSGMGGLTVLKALKEALPNESFLYLGDTARLPYGTKSRLTVVHYARQMAEILHERGVKMLVIACNTATTAALSDLQSLFSGIPVAGVIKPGANACISQSKREDILVLATETTVSSNAYPLQIHQKMPNARITSKACGLFVALAEEGLVDGPLVNEAIKHYLGESFDTQDCILLGCTHFPILKQSISEYLGNGVAIVDSAIETAKAVKAVLSDKGLLAEAGGKPSTRYLVTDSPKRFSRIGEVFLQQAIQLEDIELVDA